MYGYLRTHVPELKVREQEYYRAVYCGLCRTMGKCTGQCSRMTLSYDFTFFALVRMALTGETVTVGARRCAVHPTRRRPMVEPNQALTLSAYLSAILAYHKVRDDLRDERGLKRTAASAISPFVSAMRRKAIRRGYGEVDMQVYRAMRALSELEAARPASVDQPASLFGELMAALLAHGLEGNTAKLAQTIGLHVGLWIYILDAADDFAEDLKYNRYNPLACLYRHMLEADPTLKELPPDTRETLRLALLSELTQLEMAFDLLSTEENPDLGGLLSNLLYLGMPREAERILFGEDGTGSSSPRRRKSASSKS